MGAPDLLVLAPRFRTQKVKGKSVLFSKESDLKYGKLELQVFEEILNFDGFLLFSSIIINRSGRSNAYFICPYIFYNSVSGNINIDPLVFV